MYCYFSSEKKKVQFKEYIFTANNLHSILYTFLHYKYFT